MLLLNISNIGIITVKGADYHSIIYDNSKSEAIHLLTLYVWRSWVYIKSMPKKANIKNQVDNYFFQILVKLKKIINKNYNWWEKLQRFCALF